MANVASDVILIWTGTNATIPSGWSRETTLDDKFAKAWGDKDPDETGGASTHTHTSPAHSHILAAHTHTYSLSVSVATTNQRTSGTNQARDMHTHVNNTSGAVSGGTTQTTAITYGAYSNDPPYRKVIFIKSNGGSLATNIVALYNSNTPPSNWDNVTELSGRFMKGASDGADADLSTDNGSSTNSHSLDHTHTATGHTHVAAASSAPVEGPFGINSGTTMSHPTHTHLVSLNSGTQAITAHSSSPEQAETVEPAYAILQAIKKGATGIKVKGIIGLWLGTTTSIPAGWILCDGTQGTKDLRNKQIKIGDPAEANGGSNTHTHATYAHGHTGSGTHTHTGTCSASASTSVAQSDANPQRVAESSHTHTVASVSTPTTNYANANTTADSSSNEPEYRTAVYIELQSITSEGGSFLYSLL